MGVICLFTVVFAPPLHAGEVAKADLGIVGISLEVDRNPVTTGIDIPAVVQTIFGGKSNADAPPANGMSAVGELSGPGIDTPITITTDPGHQFPLPPLHQTGDYSLQNIRLISAEGKFLQQASPSFASINVSDILQTQISVHQLTPDELRQRGITVDARNYDVYEYTFVFGIHDQMVQVPYSVIVDKRTHQVIGLPSGDGHLPQPLQPGPPPRFQAPSMFTSFLDPPDGGGDLPPANHPLDKAPNHIRPRIPAAVVLPTGFGVLHQFFAVILNFNNRTPQRSQ